MKETSFVRLLPLWENKIHEVKLNNGQTIFAKSQSKIWRTDGGFRFFVFFFVIWHRRRGILLAPAGLISPPLDTTGPWVDEGFKTDNSTGTQVLVLVHRKSLLISISRKR